MLCVIYIMAVKRITRTVGKAFSRVGSAIGSGLATTYRATVGTPLARTELSGDRKALKAAKEREKKAVKKDSKIIQLRYKQRLANARVVEHESKAQALQSRQSELEADRLVLFRKTRLNRLNQKIAALGVKANREARAAQLYQQSIVNRRRAVEGKAAARVMKVGARTREEQEALIQYRRANRLNPLVERQKTSSPGPALPASRRKISSSRPHALTRPKRNRKRVKDQIPTGTFNGRTPTSPVPPAPPVPKTSLTAAISRIINPGYVAPRQTIRPRVSFTAERANNLAEQLIREYERNKNRLDLNPTLFPREQLELMRQLLESGLLEKVERDYIQRLLKQFAP